MNEDEKRNDVKEITELLIRLRPARSDFDSRTVFYEAGFNACQSRQASATRSRLSTLIAASVLAVAVTAPASFFLGQTAAVRTAAVQAASNRESRVAAIDSENADRAIDSAPVVVKENRLRSEQPSATNENRNPTGKSELFARWIDPLQGISESARLERESETTLAAFHSTFLSRNEKEQNWIDFPLSTTLVQYRDSFVTVPGSDAQSDSPLFAGGLQQIAQSLEVSR